MKTIITLIFTSIIFSVCQSQNTDLYLNLENGKEYKQISQSTMTLLQDINEMQFKIVVTTNSTTTFLVKQVNENGYDMEAKLDNISMSMQMGQELMSYDSEKNDPDDVFSSILGEIKGKTFNVTMSKAGKITEIKNVDAICNTAINQFEELPETQKEQIKAQIMNVYSEDALKGNIEMATAIYPDMPVNKGDKWTIHSTLTSDMPANVSTDYEFADLTTDYALIKGTSTIASADKDAIVESRGIPMSMDLTGSMQSELKVDKHTGWIIDAKINQEIKGEMNIVENAQSEIGMKINMSMINVMNMRNQ